MNVSSDVGRFFLKGLEIFDWTSQKNKFLSLKGELKSKKSQKICKSRLWNFSSAILLTCWIVFDFANFLRGGGILIRCTPVSRSSNVSLPDQRPIPLLNRTYWLVIFMKNYEYFEKSCRSGKQKGRKTIWSSTALCWMFPPQLLNIRIFLLLPHTLFKLREDYIALKLQMWMPMSKVGVQGVGDFNVELILVVLSSTLAHRMLEYEMFKVTKVGIKLKYFTIRLPVNPCGWNVPPKWLQTGIANLINPILLQKILKFLPTKWSPWWGGVRVM